MILYLVDTSKFAEITLRHYSEDEFLLDLGPSDSSFPHVVAAFQELGCKVEKHERTGYLVVRRRRHEDSST